MGPHSDFAAYSVDEGEQCIERLRQTGNVIQAPANCWTLYTGAPYHIAAGVDKLTSERILCSVCCELHSEFLGFLDAHGKRAEFLQMLWKDYVFNRLNEHLMEM